MNEQAGQAAARVDKLLHNLLVVPESAEGKIVEAMRYSILGGGKRFRAFLCCASGNLFDVDPDHSARTAAAIECVHTYSLIHDDLPCMDDDDIRRGKPSLHRAYDEATAILAGDALLTLAFEILADEQTHPRKAVRLDLIAGLTKAAGAQGMVGGQVFDMLSPELELDSGGLTHLQQMKTGALIRFSVEAAAILGGANAEQRQSLVSYANDIGLAFQIADDLLDVEGDEAEVGKPLRTDETAGKANFVTLMGVDQARERVRLLAAQAKEHLAIFRNRANILLQSVDFVLDRKH